MMTANGRRSCSQPEEVEKSHKQTATTATRGVCIRTTRADSPMIFFKSWWLGLSDRPSRGVSNLSSWQKRDYSEIHKPEIVDELCPQTPQSEIMFADMSNQERCEP